MANDMTMIVIALLIILNICLKQGGWGVFPGLVEGGHSLTHNKALAIEGVNY